MKSALFALALAPVLAAPALAEPVSCVMGDQFVPCPPGAVAPMTSNGGLIGGVGGVVGGVAGTALAVPGAVLGTTARAFDPDATGSITPAPRTYRQAPMPGEGATTWDDE